MRHSLIRYLFWAQLVTALSLLSSPAFAWAQIPDLRGTWTETNTVAPRAKEITCDAGGVASPIAYEIVKQHGRHFEGKRICGDQSERMIGIISPDNKSFYAVDDHSIITGRIVSSSELEIYNVEPGTKPIIVGVSKLARP